MGAFRRDGPTATAQVGELFGESLRLKADNAWCHNWRGVFLHAVEPDSGIAEEELREALHINKKVPPFYRNLARVILETNTKPFSSRKNADIASLCESGLALCPPESYWNWDGLRAELEAIRYCAHSLQAQHVPESTIFVGASDVEGTDPEVGW